MSKEEFIKEVQKLGIILTEEKLQKLDKYYEMIKYFNSYINLTSITDYEQVYLKHFYDSLTLVKAVDLNSINSLCDAGTGAGFPGIVLKIFYDNLNITLIDSLNKRTKFLDNVIKELDLKNIEVINSRIEDYSRVHREKYDVVTCRAVSRLSIISEICIPMVKVDGYFIPMKANIEEEIKDTSYLNNIDSKIENIITFKLPIENSIRNLIIIKKLKVTKKIYPRNFNQIKKN